jgi:hypothetical protein
MFSVKALRIFFGKPPTSHEISPLDFSRIRLLELPGFRFHGRPERLV